MELLLLMTAVLLAETSYLTYQTHKKSSTIRRFRAPIICDTSALIDGRIVAIARGGFLSGELVISRSVTRELQFMADLPDHTKRERARFGLDVIAQLQEIERLDVVIYDDGVTHADGVDEQLIVLAKKFKARLCTIDYNLNKVARTEGIAVANINELAHALRPMHLPGEQIEVSIVGLGQNKDQGVGYLDDGTMVVVDGAKKRLGSTLQVETIRMLQTEAGRMVFARLLREDTSPKQPRKVVKTSRRSPRQTIRKHSSEDSLIKLANN